MIKYLKILCLGFVINLPFTWVASAEIEIVAAEIPPYVFKDGKQVRGLVAEIVQAMAKHANHSGKIIILPWKRALSLAQAPNDGVPRLIIPLNRSIKREPLYQWIAQIFLDRTSLVTIKGTTPVIQNPNEAARLPTGVLLGSPLEQQLRDLDFKELDPAIDELTNAKKLQAGRIKVWHVARMVAPFIWKKLNLDSSNLQFGVSLDENDLFLAGTLSLESKTVKLWQDAFAQVNSSGELAKIVEKYSK